MIQLCIIADDLTGAIDTGVQLAKQGISTSVIPFMSDDLTDLFGRYQKDVLIFNTESRHIEPEVAAARVSGIVEAGRKTGVPHFYKKTDSTMRGNIGAELEAFLNSSGQDSILFVPAHPRLKRKTKEGFHFVGETLLHETEFGKDPLEPIDNSYIPELLNHQTKVPVHAMSVKKQSKTPLASGINVPNCRSQADLEEISELALANNMANYLAGSAALAEYLPKLFGINVHPTSHSDVHAPLLLANGSMNNISNNQVNHALAHGWKKLELSTDLFSNSEQDFKKIPMQLSGDLRSAFARKQDVILSTSDLELSFDESGSQSGTGGKYNFDFAAVRIGELTSQLIQQAPYQTLIIFGGDTSLGIMKAMKCLSIEPMSEIVPGVALSIAHLESGTMHIITKPGGYGEEDEITKIKDYIRSKKI